MRTRSSAPQSEQPDSKAQQPSKPPVRPSKAFILPSSASQDARFVTLPNPRTGDLTRYFFCPKLGVYEFTVVASPSQSPRSILYTSSSSSSGDSENASQKTGAISKTAELLIATPIDIIFFVIPLLCASSTNQDGKRLFQPLDDIIDSQDELPKHLRHILYNETFRETLLRRVDAVCDSVEAGDEKLFRLSEAKLLRELLAKAERMVAQGLPQSLEERFVKQVLAMPLMSVTRNDIKTSEETASPSTNQFTEENNNESDSQKDENEGKDTQSTTTSTYTSTSNSDSSTPTTGTPPEDADAAGTEEPQSTCPEPIRRLQRLSTALSFLKTAYIPTDLSSKLDDLLSSADTTPIDFTPLHSHLKYLADLRAEALASRSLGDFSRKRSVEDEDVAESRAEKKRRKEEEEKKKRAAQSRGVRELKKVNTSGMKKMSDFFAKASVKKKS